MASTELENLLRMGKLKAEPPAEAELEGLIRSGRTRLRDAEREELGKSTVRNPPESSSPG
jgi:hypothetical protein